MKKMYLNFILILIFLSSLITGCSKNNNTDIIDFYVNSDNFYMDIASSAFGFDLIFLSDEKIDDVQFLYFEGDNIDNEQIDVTLFNNSIDSYADKKIDGVYCYDYQFNAEFQNAGYYEIQSMKLKINGEEKDIEFKNPIEYNHESAFDIFNDELSCPTFVCSFPSSSLESDEEIYYDFESSVNCVFYGIEASEYFDFSDAVYYVNDVEKTLPIELKKGDTLHAVLNFKNHSSDINQFSYVFTNLEIKYELDGKDIVRRGPIEFDPLSPMDNKNETLKAYINYVENK